MCKVKIGGIANDSIVDGPGLRLAIFMQGCSNKCHGCHNPQLQNFDGGKYFTCQEILDIAKKNPLIDAVTLSGGEPFCQPESLLELVKLFKANNYNIAVYSGFTFEKIRDNEKFAPVLEFINTLVDGPFILAQRNLSLKFRGSENQRIIDVQKSLVQNKIVLDKSWY